LELAQVDKRRAHCRKWIYLFEGSNHPQTTCNFARGFVLPQSTELVILVAFGGLEEGGGNIGYLQPSRRAQLIQKKRFQLSKGKTLILSFFISYLWSFGGYYIQLWGASDQLLFHLAYSYCILSDL
jgi:hypothetical protein